MITVKKKEKKRLSIVLFANNAILVLLYFEYLQSLDKGKKRGMGLTPYAPYHEKNEFLNYSDIVKVNDEIPLDLFC